MSADLISVFEASIDGSSTHPMISSGAPALTAASRMILAASIVDCFALGCGEKMIAFLVLSEINALKIAVEVGLVVGTIPATTPIGSAILVIPKALSSSITPQVLVFLYWLYTISDAKWFLITLSSVIPIPVSEAAILASLILLLFAASAASLKITSTCS